MKFKFRFVKSILLSFFILILFQNLSFSQQKLTTTKQFEQIYKSIVEIKSYVPENARTAKSLGIERLGTGVVIDKKHILTIGYIVVEAEKIDIRLPDGKTVPGQLVGYDHQTGFGILRTIIPTNLAPLKLGNSDKINDEDMLFVMPYPSQGRASAGKAVSRRSFTGYWEYHVEKPIYVYPMNESWAGTPVLSDRGEVLGIGSLYISDSVSPGIMSPGNLFVPINILKPVMKDLIKNGRRTENINPYMGLSADDLTGILNVARVSKKGPAEQSGIQAGDLIISVNGTPVKSMEEFYKTAWKSGGPGTKIKIKVQRDKKNIDYELKSIDRMDYFVKNKGL
jgi:serine protease Do